jgi:alpha-beta hydrolase superfamily lysophospholipase
VEHHEGTFTGSEGVQLFYQAWLPPGQTSRAVLINLHGLGDHSGLYPSIARRFPEKHFAVYAYDLRGNGRSPGQRAYIRSWDQFRGDLDSFLRQVRTWQPDLPVFLMGNSLGGLIVLDYALDYPENLSGIVAAAPPLGRLGVPAFLMVLGRLASHIVPRFSLQVGMDLSGLARDPAVVEAVLADPLFHRRGTARLSTEVTRTIARVQSRAEALAVPLLLLHGSDDRMVPPDGSREFFAKVRYPDREFREYPGAYHALFADVGSEVVLSDVERWLESHLPGPSPGLAATRPAG